ncbi:MAG: O-antigen ligase C-terminal domain-containing protein [Burkholderiales bacterium]|nr:O-antigen ligase C-terminal domain-containing protein [Burkholderiales bacterium]
MLETRNAKPQTVGLLLAGGMCVLPFLLPYNQLFEGEWLAAALGVAAAFAALMGGRVSAVALPTPARWLVAFALFLGVQAVFVHPTYLQVPVIAIVFVLYAALMIWLGRQLAAASGLERVVEVLATCLLIGALANAASGVIQFYGIPDPLKDFIAEMPYGFGAYGNIGQPNLYANYLAIGGTALLFLWLRGSVRTNFAIGAAVLLAVAFALSGSRTSLLYALWYVIFGLLAHRLQPGIAGQRLRIATFAFGAIVLAAHALVPWINSTPGLDNLAKGAIERALPTMLGDTEPRWQIWLLAWRLFADAPLLGAGIGEFAGTVFRYGLPPSLTHFGNQVWTSPHNLPLQLLAETGILGTFLALAGLFTWSWQIGRRYFSKAQPAIGWIIAAVGVELIHSMFEYPLWSAHFLGVTALLIGLGAKPSVGSHATSGTTWAAAAGTCAILALTLTMLLRDYVRLYATRVTGTTITLASAANAARDAAVMRDLTHGLLGPVAEYWIVGGAPLNQDGLAERLAMSGRIAHHYPTNAILVRRVVFLALDGQAIEARKLLAQTLYTFPKRCDETIRILVTALTANRRAIEPLLELTKEAGGSNCT